MKETRPIRTCSLLLLLPGIALPFGLGSCKKEPQPPPAPVATAPAPSTKVAPPLRPQPRPPVPTKPTSTTAEAPPKAEKAPPAAARTSPDGEDEAEATVLKVRKLRGGRTTFGSGGVTRTEGEASYQVEVGLADGTRFSFLPLKNVLAKGSKVMVRYLVKDGKKTRPTLRVAVLPPDSSLSAEVLPPLRPAPIGDATFSITFPNTPDESKTDLGTLYRYDYKFSKSYHPDTYYFFRTNADGNGTPKFFRDQALSLLALTGGKRVEVRMGRAKLDKKTRLKSCPGRLTLEIGYSPLDGAIQLWFDARKKVVYGAWVLAYSPNQLAANEDMRREFFGSFSLK